MQKQDNGQSRLVRFTIRDSQNSFIWLRPTVAAMEEEIRFKTSNSENIQPFIMIVGESLKVINEVFVYFDGIKFPFKSVIRSVDCCFKIFHLFNLEYPKPCTTFWNFIETFFFEMKSKENFTKVNVLCNALKKNKK